MLLFRPKAFFQSYEDHMRVAVFSARPHDKAYLDKANNDQHEMVYFETRLTPTSVGLSAGMDAVCAFVNDDLSADVIQGLSENDVRLIALRSAGFNHVDLTAAETAGIKVCRVPAYSPFNSKLFLTKNVLFHYQPHDQQNIP
jgi:D-lactate dehydrogenase